MVGDELELGDEAKKLAFLAVQATRASALTAQAHVVLPAAAWAEVDGTITNANGRVQRLRAAVSLPGQAIPHLEILARMARASGLALDLGTASEVFADMKQRHSEFADAEFGTTAPPLLLRFAGSRG